MAIWPLKNYYSLFFLIILKLPYWGTAFIVLYGFPLDLLFVFIWATIWYSRFVWSMHNWSTYWLPTGNVDMLVNLPRWPCLAVKHGEGDWSCTDHPLLGSPLNVFTWMSNVFNLFSLFLIISSFIAYFCYSSLTFFLIMSPFLVFSKKRACYISTEVWFVIYDLGSRLDLD